MAKLIFKNIKYFALIIILILALIVIIAPFAMITFGKGGIPNTAEIFIGLFIIIAVSIMLILLFIMTTGFSFLNLTDKNQALGLPEGSIRALIALLLIAMFVIVGVYLFRSLGYPANIGTLSGLTAGDVSNLGSRVSSISPEPTLSVSAGTPIPPSTYTVTLRADVTEDGSRMAFQLLTTIATLVVAVSGFYFGTNAVREAHGVATDSLEPLIRDIFPDKDKKGAETDFTIRGKNLQNPKSVKLIRDKEEMEAEDVVSSSEMIRCKIKIDKEPDGKWDLVIVTDAGEDQLAEAFSIVPPTSENS